MPVDAAQLRLVDVSATVPALFGAEARAGSAARKARWTTSLVDPTGLEWRVRILRMPRSMMPHRPSEMIALSDPSNGWTPLSAGLVLAAFVLPFVPVVVLLRALGLVSWTIEATAYPWGRRNPPILFAYAVRGRAHAAAAMAELAAELARGSGSPVLSRARKVE